MIFVCFLRHAGCMKKYFNTFLRTILRHIFIQIYDPPMLAKRARFFFYFRQRENGCCDCGACGYYVLVTLFGSYCDDGVSAVIGVQKVTVTFILVTQIVSKLQNDCLLSGQEQACSRIETCPPLFSLYTGELNLETAFRNQLLNKKH